MLIKKKVGFDLDGVLSLTDEAIMRDAQKRGILLGRTPADIRHYYWEHAFPGEITPQVMAEILNVPGFYRDLRPCPYLVASFAHCAILHDYEVHVVTARLGPDHVLTDTLDWLGSHGLKPHAVHVCPAKEKVHYIREQRLELLVQDRFDTANTVAEFCPVLLVEAPYNVPFVSEPYGLADGVDRVTRRDVPLWMRGFLTANRYGRPEGSRPPVAG